MIACKNGNEIYIANYNTNIPVTTETFNAFDNQLLL